MWRCISLTISKIDQPEKVLEYDDNDGEIDGRPYIRVFYGCPNCGYCHLIPYEDRCPKCEKRLSWTGVR
jgi:rubrerythrin